jgi:hypothetical protein
LKELLEAAMAAAQMVLVVEERRSLLLDVGGVGESEVREDAVASGDRNLQWAPAADEEAAITEDEVWSAYGVRVPVPAQMQYYIIYRPGGGHHYMGWAGTVGHTAVYRLAKLRLAFVFFCFFFFIPVSSSFICFCFCFFL